MGIGRHGVAYHEVRSKYREPQNIQESFQVSYSSSLTSSRIYVACIACVSKRSFMVVFVAKRYLENIIIWLHLLLFLQWEILVYTESVTISSEIMDILSIGTV